MTIGGKISKLRKENNLTQEQFAEMLKVSRQSVSKWETDISFPETEKLIRISKLFSCSIDYLLMDEIENMYINQVQGNDEAKKNYMIGTFLTYLSFPPVFGVIMGIISIIHQCKTIHNRKMIVASIVGMIVSLIITSIMVAGFIFET